MEYDSINEAVLALVPSGCRHVLDLGCGGGSLGHAIRQRGAERVTGVTFNPREADLAAKQLDAVLVADLNTLDLATLSGPFDCVVCSHVLEHLYRPEELLAGLRRVLTLGGTVVVALPNILFWRSRLKLFAGHFRYTDGGLMDRTHYRFFDWRTAQELVTNAGYLIDVAVADGGFPLARFLPGVGPLLSRAVLKLWPGLFGWQFVLRGRLPVSG